MNRWEHEARFAKANTLAAEVDMADDGAFVVDGRIDWSAVAKSSGERKPSAETIKLAERMLATWRADR